ncbi:helix-turn-helix domain-containing protein [Pacificoceanicola onchidii]|uniref:helix-turn-helix domain-containing protein n=1 Tax=Pacificoceanicola onchidii TaxID=2562685 RepID=UPI00197F66FE|nr:helix-turn-helix transcriptional regulator [Pacificoceanicola onchidii]
MLAALRSAREASGHSQAQLALKLGKPPSFVGKYELGERRLDVVELLVILKALDVSCDLFLDQLTPVLPAALR